MVLWGLRQAGWVCKHYSSFWQNGYEGENTVVRTRRCSDCCADLTSIPGPMKRDPFAQLFALAKPILSEYAKICYIYNYTNINIWWLLLGQATHHGSNQIPSASSALRPPSWCDGGGSWWNVGHDAAKSFGSEFMVYPWVPVPPKNGRDGRNGLNESSLWCSFIVELVFFIARSS